MNYSEIKDLAIAYSMRKDVETANMMDSFLRIVESKIDRALSTKEMFYRSVLETSSTKGYYGLPEGFMALRDIQIQDTITGGDKVTPQYVAPEMMNSYISEDSSKCAYTIIANQIQIHPAQDDKQLEIVYRKRVTPLTDKNPTTWLSIQAPDAYVFGLLVEISAFAKDLEAAQLWVARFDEVLNHLQTEDDSNRWSGPALRIELG